MKLCKKTLSLILVAAILLSVAIAVTLGAVANDVPEFDESKPNITVVADKTSVKAGETVKLTFSINKNPGIWAVNFTCKMDNGLTLLTDGKDEKGFTKVKYQVGENFKKFVTISPADNKELIYLYSNSNIGFNNTASGELFSVWVKVDENASLGDYNIKFTDYSIIDNNKKDVEFTFGSEKISVIDDTVTTVPTETTTGAENTTTGVEETTTVPVVETTTGPVETTTVPVSPIETTTNPQITTTKPEEITTAIPIITTTTTRRPITTTTTTTVSAPTTAVNSNPAPAVTINLKTKVKLKLTPYKKALRVKIKQAVKGAGGYQVQIAKNKKFKKATVKTTAKTTLKIKKLKRTTKYFVRVRPYQNIGAKTVYGAWSKVYTKKTK